MAAQKDISEPRSSLTVANAALRSRVTTLPQHTATTDTFHTSSTIIAAPPSLKDRGSIELSRHQQQHMFSSLNAIFERAEEAEGGVGVSELRAVSETDDDNGRFENKVNALKDVRGILDQMWWGNSDFLITAAEVLADGSRDRTSSRTENLLRASLICI